MFVTQKQPISYPLDANCPEIYVSQLSGHKSLQSLNSYKTASLQQQRTMSHILSRESSSSSVVQMAPAAPSASESSSGVTAKSLFSGASIGSISGCTFNFVCGPQESSPAPAPRKRRRVIESDSDEDWFGVNFSWTSFFCKADCHLNLKLNELVKRCTFGAWNVKCFDELLTTAPH